MPPPTPTCSAAASGAAINVTYAVAVNATLPALFLELWRQDSVLGPIRIATNLVASASNQTYNDYHVAHGLSYVYWCRAYATDGSSADSTKTSGVSFTLGGQACLSDTLAPASFNALVWDTSLKDAKDFRTTNPSVISTGGAGAASRHSNSTKAWLMEFKGNTAPTVSLVDVLHRLITLNGIIRGSEIATQWTNLLTLHGRQSTVCIRDNQGNKFFASFPRLEPKYTVFGYEVTCTLYGVYYNEAK